MDIALLILFSWFAFGFITAVGIKVLGWPGGSDIGAPPQALSIMLWPIVYFVLMAHYIASFVENNIPNLVDTCADWIKEPQDEPKKKKEQDQLKQNELS